MQNTISNPITISGVGIHSGKKVNMTLLPAGPNNGIVFRSHKGHEVAAKFENVTSTNMSTTLSNGLYRVDVVEHIMAALWGCNIDNITIMLDANEIPICDGGAAVFVNEMKKARVTQQDTPREILKISKKIEVRDGDKYIIMSPHDGGLIIDMTIDFDHPVIGRQHYLFNSEITSFENEIATARTFGFVRDLELMHNQGLALGASLENCIGLNEYGVANPEGLHFPDEFVRHKVLDCLGDLFLSGFYIHGHIEAYKTGHKLNNLALQELFLD